MAHMDEDTDLYRLALEHLMRITDDEAGAWVFATSPRGSQEMLSALGRLLGTSTHLLDARSPLVCWATGSSAPDPQWRDHLHQHPSSLWSRLEFLGALYDSTTLQEVPHDLALLLALDEATATGFSC
jgi:hypothetical protein